MTAGLQIFDGNGNIVFDATYRMMRVINSRRMDGTNGSLSDDRIAQGGWFSFQPDVNAGDGYLSGGVIVPRFAISGNVLSWSYAAKHSTQYDIYQTGTLFYGAS